MLRSASPEGYRQSSALTRGDVVDILGLAGIGIPVTDILGPY